MKKCLLLILGIIASVVLAGCSFEEETVIYRPQIEGVRPADTLYICHECYVPLRDILVTELPDGYQYIGNVTQEWAGDPKLMGYKVYSDGTQYPERLYLYQKFGGSVRLVEWGLVRYGTLV